MLGLLKKYAADGSVLKLSGADLNPLTLRFRDAEFERLFQEEHTKRDFPQAITYMAIGILSWISYSILDFLVLSGEELWSVIVIRLLVLPILGFILWLSLLPSSRRYMQWILSATMAAGGGGVIAMTAVLSQPFSHMYYAGLILIIIFFSNFLLFRFTFNIAVAGLLFTAYVVTAVQINPLPSWAFMNNTFFLSAAIVWTIYTRYWSDFYIRSDFANRYFLLQEKRRSEDLLDSAEAGNRAKSEFLAVMSHELRTPLNAIIGFSEVIQQKLFGPLGNEKYESYVKDIADSGHHLLSIINDILDLSKAEAGKLVLNEDDLPLYDTIEQVLRMFREQAAERSIVLNFDPPQEELILAADPRQFRQILINVVSNAVKFTRGGGSVTLSAEQARNGDVRVVVEDTGIGIEESHLPKIVDPFVQVESSMSRENGGTGLGLPLVKKIAELHGGELHISSKLGVGTRVTVAMPASRLKRRIDMGVKIEEVA